MKTLVLLNDGARVKLDERHKIFCEAFVSNGGDRLAAAKEAGVGNTSALLENHEVQAYINFLIAKVSEREETTTRVSLSVDKVLGDLAYAKTLALEPFYDAQGNKRRDVKTYLKAIEMEGSFLSMWNNRPQEAETKAYRPLGDLPLEALEAIEEIIDQSMPAIEDAEVLSIGDKEDDKSAEDYESEGFSL